MRRRTVSVITCIWIFFSSIFVVFSWKSKPIVCEYCGLNLPLANLIITLVFPTAVRKIARVSFKKEILRDLQTFPIINILICRSFRCKIGTFECVAWVTSKGISELLFGLGRFFGDSLSSTPWLDNFTVSLLSVAFFDILSHPTRNKDEIKTVL